MAKDSIEKSEMFMACFGGIIFAVFIALISLTFSGCGSGKDSQTSSTSVSSVCVAGDTIFTVPEDVADEVTEVEDSSDGDEDPVVAEETGELNQSGALRLLKVTIIGNCNDVHTEDNDVVSDDDTNVQLGQQQQ